MGLETHRNKPSQNGDSTWGLGGKPSVKGYSLKSLIPWTLLLQIDIGKGEGFLHDIFLFDMFLVVILYRKVTAWCVNASGEKWRAIRQNRYCSTQLTQMVYPSPGHNKMLHACSGYHTNLVSTELKGQCWPKIMHHLKHAQWIPDHKVTILKIDKWTGLDHIELNAAHVIHHSMSTLNFCLSTRNTISIGPKELVKITSKNEKIPLSAGIRNYLS